MSRSGRSTPSCRIETASSRQAGDDADRAVLGTEGERVAERRDVEPPARRAEQRAEVEALDVVDEAVVREDREAGRLEREEGHELVARGRVPPRVLDRGLVAVVAVGDEHRPR